jgi:hypothetical protein
MKKILNVKKDNLQINSLRKIILLLNFMNDNQTVKNILNIKKIMESEQIVGSHIYIKKLSNILTKYNSDATFRDNFNSFVAPFFTNMQLPIECIVKILTRGIEYNLSDIPIGFNNLLYYQLEKECAFFYCNPSIVIDEMQLEELRQKLQYIAKYSSNIKLSVLEYDIYKATNMTRIIQIINDYLEKEKKILERKKEQNKIPRKRESKKSIQTEKNKELKEKMKQLNSLTREEKFFNIEESKLEDYHKKIYSEYNSLNKKLLLQEQKIQKIKNQISNKIRKRYYTIDNREEMIKERKKYLEEKKKLISYNQQILNKRMELLQQKKNFYERKLDYLSKKLSSAKRTSDKYNTSNNVQVIQLTEPTIVETNEPESEQKKPRYINFNDNIFPPMNNYGLFLNLPNQLNTTDTFDNSTSIIPIQKNNNKKNNGKNKSVFGTPSLFPNEM